MRACVCVRMCVLWSDFEFHKQLFFFCVCVSECLGDFLCIRGSVVLNLLVERHRHTTDEGMDSYR